MPIVDYNYNPPSLTYNYTKFSGVVPNSNVTFEITSVHTFYQYTVKQIPNWVTFSLIELVGETSEYSGLIFKITVNPAVANNLPAGTYQGTLKIDYDLGPYPLPVSLKTSFPITLNVIEGVPLTISPSSFNFTAEEGGSNPPSQYFNITTDGNWSISPSEPWLSFSALTGAENALITLDVDISSLSIGNHSATFLVDDGTDQKLGSVYLTITGSPTAGNLIVLPQALDFSETFQQSPGDSRVLTISTDEAATISSNVSWLDFSTNSVGVGFNQVNVSTQNTQTLPVGIYQATITVTTSNFIEYTYVTLFIVKKETGGLVSNGFYFAKSRNRLTLTHQSSNTEAEIIIKAQATTGLKVYRRVIPYFRNLLSFIFGLETEVHLQSNPVPEPLSTQVYYPIKPVIYNVEVFNKTLGTSVSKKTTDTTSSKKFSNMEFINGSYPAKNEISPSKIPTDTTSTFSPYTIKNVLTKLPSSITVPTDGVVMFSARDSVNIPDTTLTVVYSPDKYQIPSPIKAKTPSKLASTTSNYDIYTVIINFAGYKFSPGTKILVESGIIRFYVIIEDYIHLLTQIIWENEWQCPECFNAKGPLKITAVDGKTTTTKAEEGKERTTVIEVLEPETFELSTGNIHSQEEIAFLADMLRSKKVILQSRAKRYEVVCTSRDLDSFLTRRNNEAITLKFKKSTS